MFGILGGEQGAKQEEETDTMGGFKKEKKAGSGF